MGKKQNEFRRVIVASVICTVILFLLVLSAGGAIFMMSARNEIKPTQNDAITAILRSEMARMEEHVGGAAEAVTRIATSRSIQRFFGDPSNEIAKRMAFEELDARRAEFAVTGDTIFWVIESDREMFYYDRYVSTINPSGADDFWYAVALLGSGSVNLSINHDTDRDKIGIRIAAPVLGGNRTPAGVVGIDSDLSRFVNAFYDDYHRDAPLYFFNAFGEITCANDIKLVTQKKRLGDKLGYVGGNMLSAARKLRPGETQTFSTPIGDIGIIMAPSFEWYAITVIPNAKSGHEEGVIWFFATMGIVMGAILVIFNGVIIGAVKPLRDTMKTLEAALKVKDDFLARMSHEIRTPMNAITGMAELALREDMSAPAQEHVYTIKQAGANLLSIINDILDLSKIDSGKLKIIPAEYHFATLVNDVVSIIRMRVMDSPVRFVVNTDSRIPAVLLGDEVRVRQILLNILSNAVKYTTEGFISLAISGKHVDDDTVVLTIDVTDTGKGIKPEDIGKLFVNFAQVDVEANRGIEGTGLGLAITKNLTTAMGGKIGVTSEYGKGCTFTITLPQKIYSDEPLAAVDNHLEKSVIVCERRDIYANSMVCTIDNLGVRCVCANSYDELRNKLKAKNYSFVFVESDLYEGAKKIVSELNSTAETVLLTCFGKVIADKDLSVIAMPAHSVPVANILNGVSDGFSYHTDKNTVVKFNAPEAKVLVVDDIRTNLEVTKGLLSPYDMRVDVCQSGVEAIKMAKETDYDIIFMDHMMPDMDGIEATKHIRALGGACAKIPIIALTANAVSGAKEMFLQNDFNGFLSKPVDVPKLNATLEKWIPKKKQRPAQKKTERMDTAPDILIDGVDTQAGIARMGGDPDAYLRTLSIFHGDCREKAGELKGTLTSGNLKKFTILAHALKGAAANIGASAFSETAKAMEMAGKREDMTYIKEHIGDFLSSLAALLRDIKRATDSVKGTSAESTGGDADKNVINALSALRTAINDLDPDVINAAAKELRTIAGASSFGGKIEPVLQNTLIGEFDAAVAMIDKLLKEEH